MKKLVSLMLVGMLLLLAVSPVFAYTEEEFSDISWNAVKRLKESGRLSNDEINYTLIDLTQIETQGTVTATVYATVYEEKTGNYFDDILKQTPECCYNKLTRFIFELTNRYKPEYTTYIMQTHHDELTVSTWVYGQYKDQATYALLSGIPDCLNHEPYSRYNGDGDSSWVDRYSPEVIGTKPIESFSLNEVFVLSSLPYTSTTLFRPFIFMAYLWDNIIKPFQESEQAL